MGLIRLTPPYREPQLEHWDTNLPKLLFPIPGHQVILNVDLTKYRSLLDQVPRSWIKKAV